MIRSFSHKGLNLFYEHGDASKLQPAHINKIRLILTNLSGAISPLDMNISGWKLHQLTGDLKQFWSVKVDKNYRIIFRFVQDNAYAVEYLGYN